MDVQKYQNNLTPNTSHRQNLFKSELEKILEWIDLSAEKYLNLFSHPQSSVTLWKGIFNLEWISLITKFQIF